MIPLLLFLALQAPPLAEAASAELGPGDRLYLKSSFGGRFLVVGGRDTAEIRDATTLALLKELRLRSTAVGFNPGDGQAVFVGDEVVRFSTKEWRERSRQKLEDAQFKEAGLPRKWLNVNGTIEAERDGLRPAQAMVTPELDLYYVNHDGMISAAVYSDGKLESKSLGLKPSYAIERVDFIFGRASQEFLLGGYRAAGSSKGTVYELTGCRFPLAAAALDFFLVFVGREEEAYYDPKTLKCRGARTELANLSAAFDPKNGWVYVSDKEGVRVWAARDFKNVLRYEEFKGPVQLLEAGDEGRALYSLEGRRLRRWTVKP